MAKMFRRNTKEMAAAKNLMVTHKEYKKVAQTEGRLLLPVKPFQRPFPQQPLPQLPLSPGRLLPQRQFAADNCAIWRPRLWENHIQDCIFFLLKDGIDGQYKLKACDMKGKDVRLVVPLQNIEKYIIRADRWHEFTIPDGRHLAIHFKNTRNFSKFLQGLRKVMKDNGKLDEEGLKTDVKDLMQRIEIGPPITEEESNRRAFKEFFKKAEEEKKDEQVDTPQEEGGTEKGMSSWQLRNRPLPPVPAPEEFEDDQDDASQIAPDPTARMLQSIADPLRSMSKVHWFDGKELSDYSEFKDILTDEESQLEDAIWAGNEDAAAHWARILAKQRKKVFIQSGTKLDSFDPGLIQRDGKPDNIQQGRAQSCGNIAFGATSDEDYKNRQLQMLGETKGGYVKMSHVPEEVPGLTAEQQAMLEKAKMSARPKTQPRISQGPRGLSPQQNGQPLRPRKPGPTIPPKPRIPTTVMEEENENEERPKTLADGRPIPAPRNARGGICEDDKGYVVAEGERKNVKGFSGTQSQPLPPKPPTIATGDPEVTDLPDFSPPEPGKGPLMNIPMDLETKLPPKRRAQSETLGGWGCLRCHTPNSNDAWECKLCSANRP